LIKSDNAASRVIPVASEGCTQASSSQVFFFLWLQSSSSFPKAINRLTQTSIGVCGVSSVPT
jgi:hypothetical protein